MSGMGTDAGTPSPAVVNALRTLAEALLVPGPTADTIAAALGGTASPTGREGEYGVSPSGAHFTRVLLCPNGEISLTVTPLPTSSLTPATLEAAFGPARVLRPVVAERFGANPGVESVRPRQAHEYRGADGRQARVTVTFDGPPPDGRATEVRLVRGWLPEDETTPPKRDLFGWLRR